MLSLLASEAGLKLSFDLVVDGRRYQFLARCVGRDNVLPWKLRSAFNQPLLAEMVGHGYVSETGFLPLAAAKRVFAGSRRRKETHEDTINQKKDKL